MASAMPRDRLILLVGLITYGMGQSLLFVIFAPIARQLGIEEWQLGFIIAASNVMLAFSAPRWGRASQRLGRRTVYLIGLAGYAVGYALLAFGVQLGLLDVITGGALFALLLALRLAYGLVVGGINPAATAYIADTTDEKSRGAGMALVAMSGGLGHHHRAGVCRRPAGDQSAVSHVRRRRLGGGGRNLGVPRLARAPASRQRR